MKSLFFIGFFLSVSIANAQFSSPILFQGKNVQGVTRTGAGINGGFYSVGIFDDGGGAIIRDGQKEISIPANSDTFPYSHSTALLCYFSSTNRLVWNQRINAESGIAIWDASSDAEGNFLICGNFKGLALFPTIKGRPKAIQSQVLAAGSEKMPLNSFVAKYSPDGTLLWVKCVKSPEHSAAFQVLTNSNNEVFVRYYFHGNTLVSDKFALVNSLRLYNLDILLIKFDSNGNEQWLIGGGEFYSKDFYLNEKGNPVIQGVAYGDRNRSGILFSSNQDTVRLSNVSSLSSLYSVEVSDKGTFSGVKLQNPPNHNLIVSKQIVELDGSSVALGAPQPTESYGRDFKVEWNGAVTKTQWYDFFLYAMDSSGLGKWKIDFKGKNGQYPIQLKKLSNGNYLISGWFEGTMDVVDATGQTFTFEERAQNSFLSEVNSFGRILWIKQIANFFGDQYTRPVLTTTELGDGKVMVSGTMRCNSSYNGLYLLPDDEIMTYANRDTSLKIKFYQHVDGFITSYQMEKLANGLVVRIDKPVQSTNGDRIPKPKPVTTTPASGNSQVSLIKRDFLFYPNPIRGEGDRINLEFETSSLETISWRIINTNGVQIFQKTGVYPTGKQTEEIQIGGLKAGTYFLIMETPKERISKTILVL